MSAFTSTARLSKPFLFLLAGIAAIQIIILALFAFMPSEGGGLLPISIGVPVFVLLLSVPMLFATTRLTIDAEQVHAKTFGFFSTTIKRSDIVDAQVGAPTGLGAGAGLRIMGNCTTGYLTGGPNLALELADGTRTAVSTPRPEEAKKALGY
ncbi:hypothetical protein [Rothia sp. ZJ932]|uniref:hypothetical protein n=1 Tax=Rothia sp. ZJ932 TaxID=2810516 RepID=UPI00196831AB|nr:hypothetical protein [Rothia sp. ZJ932]QRZ60897.1 hypothetical protein JR346_06370 [Rothia sp. ZJ932]